MDVRESDFMKIFNCNPEWPICMYDFTYKNKTNQQQTMRSRNLLSNFIVHNHFYPEDIQDNKTKKSEKYILL